MQIHDYVTPFLEKYEPTANYYETFFAKYPEIYNYYFQLHCKNKELKLELACKNHPQMLEQMKWVAKHIPNYVEEITKKYNQLMNVQFTEDVFMFVGLGGSNAYTTRSMNPQIAFCVERIEAKEDSLKTLVAHEFGHAVHNIMTDQSGIKAGDIDWTSPYTWLFQEGMATYLSTQVVDAKMDVYFAYGHDEQWLEFAKQNESHIIHTFLEDLAQLSSQEIFKEWFSINGGSRFGYTRLAYYIGYTIVSKIVEENTLKEAILFWKSSEFEKEIDYMLKSLV